MLTTQLQQFQFYDKYSRFNYEESRRETWEETIDRAMNFLRQISNDRLPEEDYALVQKHMLDGNVMPSMRLMAMAGPASHRENNVLYNCAYLPIDSISSFVEMMVICMGGTGVGYSVERQYTDKLPKVEYQRPGMRLNTYEISDSSDGWAQALKAGLLVWWSGYDIDFDYSKIRPQGAPLRTKGGRASGPEPLRQLLDFSRNIILAAQGRRLTSLELHDIATKLGDVVVQGGVRRSALIALFDADDVDMLTCKDPGNIEGNWHRYNANNSAVWTRKMSREEIERQMNSMHDGGNGEPGIFNRLAAQRNAPARREAAEFGTNPCGEITLRPRQFCNLTTAIARHDDTMNSLTEKVKAATILGTIQSAATWFPGLPQEWTDNCEEERLLGVDINGQMDSPLFAVDSGLPLRLTSLQLTARTENERVASLIGINASTAITCVKPSGNSSVLLDCSPGIHPRHAKYYVRRVRVSKASSMYHLLYLSGFDMKPENGQEHLENPTMYVASFYVKAPDGAVVKGDRGATEQLDYWLKMKMYYTEHNPSATITYREHELQDIITWLYDNQEYVNGLSFLPASDMMYEQAPYEEIDEETYREMSAKQPDIRFDMLVDIDHGIDNTTASQELACFAGQCDI